MPDWVWTILLLMLIAALIYAAFMFGRAMAGKENSSAASGPPTGTEVEPHDVRVEAPQERRTSPRPTAPPPPALAGSRDGQSGYQTAAAPKRSAPPPATAAGASAPASRPASAAQQPEHRAAPPPAAASGERTASASTHTQPKRTAAPPPAQAAWSGGKSDPAKPDPAKKG